MDIEKNMKSRTRIKICGLRHKDDVKAAVDAGADAIGFVFFRDSPRCVRPDDAAKLIRTMPPFVTPVGLFVNAKAFEVEHIARHTGIGLLQFHGDETAEYCAEIAESVNLPFIRAFRVKPETKPQDLVQYEQQYRNASTRFSGILLDSYTPAYGGSGKVFNWSLISKEIAHQAVLSGGLNTQNVADAILGIRPYAVDVSSGVEIARGIKCAIRIRDFISAVRAADREVEKSRNPVENRT